MFLWFFLDPHQGVYIINSNQEKENVLKHSISVARVLFTNLCTVISVQNLFSKKNYLSISVRVLISILFSLHIPIIIFHNVSAFINVNLLLSISLCSIYLYICLRILLNRRSQILLRDFVTFLYQSDQMHWQII